MSQLLLEHLGIETTIDFTLVAGITVGLKRSDQSAEARREDDQITRAVSGTKGVGDTCGHEHRCSRANGLTPIHVAERQLAVQNVPRFVIGMMDVKDCGAAASPLMNAK